MMTSITKNIKSLFRIEFLVVGSVLFIYGLILFYIKKGISSDEGYYLIGYLKNQELGPMPTDFHNIVRAITPDGMQDNVMYFRYLRYVLDFISLLLFGISVFAWIKNRKPEFKLSPLLFVSFILLSGTISYTYTTATISFDHLQHIVFLFAFSVFIFGLLSKNPATQLFYFFLCGLFTTLAITNYLPSGILLFFTFITLIIIDQPDKSAISKVAILLISVFIGFLLYNFFINPLSIYIENLKISMEIASDGGTQHNSLGLLTEMLSAVAIFLLIQVSVCIIAYFLGKIKWSLKVVVPIVVLLTIGLIYERKFYYLLEGYVYYLPVSFAVGIWAAKKGTPKFKLPEFLIFLIFSLFPFMGIFGTNQSIIMKVVTFVPFWMCLFLVLAESVKGFIKSDYLLMLVVLILFTFGYIYQGNFRRYHSYYTPRASKYELIDGARYNDVKVSAYEQNYYHTLADTLRSVGFRPGETAIGFGEHQIGLYFIGAYFHGPLVYSMNQYIKIPQERAKYILISEMQEENVKKHLQNSGWNFPEDYEKIELGIMAENLPPDYYTLIYYIK